MSLFNRFFGKNPTQSKSVVPEETQKLESGSKMSEPIISPEVTTVSNSESTNPTFDKRTIRVFISSTFRDMVEDRNALMTHCWPELRRFCKERQVELVEVDLRWGIAEEQSTRKETLKLCLDEIRACRPFFIGLLGERYGWVPDETAFTNDLMEEQPWLTKTKWKSVTELEILHGVLNNPEMAGRAFFFFRDPKYIESLSKEKKADFLSETSADADKQTLLKNLIRKTCIAKNIPLLETYPDPQSLAAIVLEQLKEAIGIQFPIEDNPDPLTREALDHEAFAESRRRTYIGQPDYFDTLNKHCLDTGKPLVLLGDSGSGKSALLANWLYEWRKAHPTDFIFQHYIGGTPDGAVHWKLMTRLMAEIKRWTDDPEELPKTNDDMLRDFPLWLSKAQIIAEHRGVRCVIISDALNQLEDKDHGRLLGWLPEHPFNGSLRFIASTLPGDTMEAIEKREWSTLKIKPLEIEERRRMIVEYLARFSKKLDEPRLKRLSSEPATANPLYLKVLLDELRVTGTHEKLDERLDDYLSAKDIPSLLNKVLDRYQRDYEHDYKGLVGEALGLIWAARRGLTETELLELLRPNNLPQLPLVIWSPLRATLEDSLIERGGILNFAHDFLRTAVENAFLPDLDKKDDYRIQLADYFEPLPPTERSCDELPWLLWKTESLERLRNCLLNIDCFLEICNRDKNELRGYWVYLKEERNMGRYYLDSFNAWIAKKGTNNEIRYLAANQLGFFLNDNALHFNAESFLRLALQICEEIFGKGHLKVAIPLNNLALSLQATNRINEAESLMRRSLQISENNFGTSHPKVAHILINLAQILQDTSRYSEAEQLMRRALQINENSYGKEHLKVAVCLNNLAGLFQNTNRILEVEPLLIRVLEIFENSHGKDHPYVAIVLNNLAELFQVTNRMSEAETMYRRSLQIDIKNFGNDHPKVAKRLNNLATIFRNTNRKEEAELLLRSALKIDEDCLGNDHPNVARDINNLAQLLKDQNQIGEAELLMKRVIEISEKSFGENHINLAMGLSNLAQLYKDTKRISEAEPMMIRVNEIFEIIYGANNPNLAIGLNNLADLYGVTNRKEKAEPLLRRALAIFMTSLGVKHPNTIGVISNYKHLLRTMGWSENQIIDQLRKIAPDIL